MTRRVKSPVSRLPDIAALIAQYGPLADKNRLPLTIHVHPDGWSHPTAAALSLSGPPGTMAVATILPVDYFVGW